MLSKDVAQASGSINCKYPLVVGNAVAPRTGLGLEGQVLVNPCNWRFLGRAGNQVGGSHCLQPWLCGMNPLCTSAKVNKAVNSAAGSDLERYLRDTYGTAVIGKAYPSPTPPGSQLKEQEGIAVVVNAMAPTNNPNDFAYVANEDERRRVSGFPLLT